MALPIENLSVPISEMLVRIGVSLIAGLVIGFERERHGRAAGLRTTTLVCVASAVAMILSEFLYVQGAPPGGAWRPDPARLAAGILTGMGFLGAGSIVRHENVVRGVTTAAVLWFMSVLGLAFGSGYLLLGLCGLAVAVAALYILPALDRWVQNDWYGTVFVSCDQAGLQPEVLRQRIQTMGFTVKKMDIDVDLVRHQRNLRCEVKFKKGQGFGLSQKIVDELAAAPGVLQVKWTS